MNFMVARLRVLREPQVEWFKLSRVSGLAVRKESGYKWEKDFGNLAILSRYLCPDPRLQSSRRPAKHPCCQPLSRRLALHINKQQLVADPSSLQKPIVLRREQTRPNKVDRPRASKLRETTITKLQAQWKLIASHTQT